MVEFPILWQGAGERSVGRCVRVWVAQDALIWLRVNIYF